MMTLWDRFVAGAGVRDYIAITGVVLTTIGTYQVYRPAAWLFVGLFCLWLAFRPRTTT